VIEAGIFAKTFRRGSLGETLDAVAEHGIEAIQFNMAIAGGPSLPPEIPPETAAEIRAAVAARGLTMAAVSGTYNMALPIGGSATPEPIASQR
jgi:sugar phosphate isomerase/epimerase